MQVPLAVITTKSHKKECFSNLHLLRAGAQPDRMYAQIAGQTRLNRSMNCIAAGCSMKRAVAHIDHCVDSTKKEGKTNHAVWQIAQTRMSS